LRQYPVANTFAYFHAQQLNTLLIMFASNNCSSTLCCTARAATVASKTVGTNLPCGIFHFRYTCVLPLLFLIFICFCRRLLDSRNNLKYKNARAHMRRTRRLISMGKFGATSRKNSAVRNVLTSMILTSWAMHAYGAEGYRTRQAPFGQFGGDIAAEADTPGFFGTALLTNVTIDRVADENGNQVVNPARVIPMPTGPLTAGAIPNGTYTYTLPAAPTSFHQSQQVLSLLGGYLTEDTYFGGHLALAIELGYTDINRTATITLPAATITPTPPATLSPGGKAVITAITSVINTKVQASLNTYLAAQNVSASGVTDSELAAVWVRHEGNLKLVAGATLFVPTGVYDINRGPNPGFGNFYTLRPGIAASYALNKNHTSVDWDSGVTVAGRMSVDFNSTNKDTEYRSGDLLYTELAIVKVSGNWAVGTNVSNTTQFTDDSGSGVNTPLPYATSSPGPLRYRVSSIGPFLSYKFRGEAGLNLNYSRNFDARNSLSGSYWQMSFIKAW
jgi:hypothetical protein